jgi:predicted CopG family antitoxin
LAHPLVGVRRDESADRRWESAAAINEPAAPVKYVNELMHAAATKVISLSERAYNELKKRKGEGESFSDVVRKMAAGKRLDSIMELAGTWAGDDAKEVLSQLMKQRRATRSREFGGGASVKSLQ